MENIKELATALAKFQGKLGPITHNKTVQIPTKSGRLISFSYADLPHILSSVRPLLSEFGLSITQVFSEKQMVTYLFHESGESIKSEFTLDWKPDAKDVAAEITYFRRYAITALLGISGEDDMDAETQEAKEKTVSKNTARNTEALGSSNTSEFLSEAQAKYITLMINGDEYLEAQILKEQKVESISRIPKLNATAVIDQLKRKAYV